MSNSETRPKLTFGLDLGVGSVGLCVLNPEAERIEGLYVRAFDKAENPKNGESKNKVRREARGTRRRLRRRRTRLRACLRDLLPFIVEATTPEELLASIKQRDPWAARVDGLDNPLNNIDFAVAVYHLQKHRGFQSNRKADQEEKELSTFKAHIEENRGLMEEVKARTLGELAALHPKFSSQKRNRRGDYSRLVDRREVVEELRMLFRCQRDLSPENPLFSSEREEAQVEIILRRKPTASGDMILERVGMCFLEKEEKRGAAATYTAERFKWLCSLNSCRLKTPSGERELTAAERALLINKPFDTTKLTFKQARSALGLADDTTFNLCRYRSDRDEDEKRTWFEAKAYHALRKVLSKPVVEQLSADEIDYLGHCLTVYKTDDDLRQALADTSLTEAQVEALLMLSFDRFGKLSTKAMRAMLPFLEEGHVYSEAAKQAGYHHSENALRDAVKQLPPIDEDIPNPVVRRAVHQAIKVLNAAIKKHGLPEQVHIELSRDVGRSFKERKDREREQLKNRDRKLKIAEQFEELFDRQPKNGFELRKLEFYRQQNGQCLYSGKPMDIERLFETGYVDIDHILPFSRTCDDSLNNKCLVLGVENRRKGNRTPFEYLGNNDESEAWKEFEARVSSLPGVPFPKKQRLRRKALGPVEDFIARNLNDSRYLSRLLKGHIESYLRRQDGHPIRVVTPAGQITALLRARWGLVKHREHGDLHHALDAAVVASCGQGLIQRLTRHAKREELEKVGTAAFDYETGEVLDLNALRDADDEFPMPYAHFRSELLGRLDEDPKAALAGVPGYEEGSDALGAARPILVSRPPRRLGTGAAHEETIRCVGRHAEYGNVNKVYTKKKLQDLKLNDLANIRGADTGRETRLIEALRQRLEEHKDDGKKAFADDKPFYKPSRDGVQGPRVYSVKVGTTSTTGLLLEKKGGLAHNGDMARLDVYRTPRGWIGVPIYVYHLVGGTPRPGDDVQAEFAFSLYPGVFTKVVKGNGDEVTGYYVTYDIATRSITLVAHDRDQRKGKAGLYRGLGILRLREFAIADVSPLGDLSWRQTVSAP